MSHYFVTPEDDGSRNVIRAKIWDRDYEFVAASGVFSAHRLDLGTRVLLTRTTPPGEDAKTVLDLGCGFGPIAVALAKECPWAEVDAVDVNELALKLTQENAEKHGVKVNAPFQNPWSANARMATTTRSGRTLRSGSASRRYTRCY